MDPLARKIGACLAVGLAVAWNRPDLNATSSAGQPVPCEAPVGVDGELRCEGEWPEELGRWCLAHGERPPPVPVRVHPGDAIEPRATCRRGVVTRLGPDAVEALGLAVDLNGASAPELASLPRIGPALARRIIDARPHVDVTSLADVRGIGPKTIAQLRERARIGPGPVLVVYQPASPGRRPPRYLPRPWARQRSGSRPRPP